MSVYKLVVVVVVVIVTITTSNRSKAETSRLTCWTFSGKDSGKSYLFYSRNDPEQIVFVLSNNHSSYMHHKTFKSSRLILGAVAADDKQPISVFIHDKPNGSIHFFKEDLGTSKPIFKGSSTQVEDIAVDWLSSNIYYTDPLLGIGIVSYQGRFNIIIRKTAALHGIDVDPMSGLLFYADGDSGHIHQADLTGGNQKILSGPASAKPRALVTDAVNKILYWLDEGTQYLQSWNYATSEFKRLWTSDVVGPGAFVSMDIYKNYLFLAMANRTTVYVIATNGSKIVSFSARNHSTDKVYGFAMSAPERQINTDSACNIDNGGCEHICIHESNVKNRCLCQFGYRLDGDKCKSEPLLNNFLMFVDASTGTIYQVHLNDSDHNRFRALSISQSTPIRPELTAYDPEEKHIYWSEKNEHEIWKLDLLKAGSEEIFINLGSSSEIQVMMIDQEERYLYFIDNGLKQIARININTKKREFIVQFAYEELPLSIELDVESRSMYWIDGGDNPKIERANMDNGRDRVTLVFADIKEPAGLAVDLDGEYIYWLDKGLKAIMRADIHGQNRELFIVVADDGASGLAVDKDYIYLAERRVLSKISVQSRSKQDIGPVYFVIDSGVTHHKYEAVRPITDATKPKISVETALLIGLGTVGFLITTVVITAIAIALRRGKRNKSRSSAHNTTNETGARPRASSGNRTDGQTSRPYDNPRAPSSHDNTCFDDDGNNAYEVLRR